jgi:hypothetical protein
VLPKRASNRSSGSCNGAVEALRRMKFVPDIQAIKRVIESRLLIMGSRITSTFPTVLHTKPLHWLSFGDDKLFGLLFLNPGDIDRVKNFQSNGWDPFPGLFSTDAAAPALFRLERSRMGWIDSCEVKNSVAFSIGPDSTFVVVNHTQELDTPTCGTVSYKLPLGYFISFGTEITTESAYETLDELVAYSVKTWTDKKGA